MMWIYVCSTLLVQLHSRCVDLNSINVTICKLQEKIHFSFSSNSHIFRLLKPHFCWTRSSPFLPSELCPLTLFPSCSHLFIPLSLPISELLVSLTVNLLFILWIHQTLISAVPFATAKDVVNSDPHEVFLSFAFSFFQSHKFLYFHCSPYRSLLSYKWEFGVGIVLF